ncbi:MAG: hypothetical protein OXC68_08950 [Aestuariivita sp.]|nr:hypothetical protein [Aestuariivita sp.]
MTLDSQDSDPNTGPRFQSLIETENPNLIEAEVERIAHRTLELWMDRRATAPQYIAIAKKTGEQCWCFVLDHHSSGLCFLHQKIDGIKTVA